MGRPKGEGKTPGSGRKKGTPNKVTIKLRESIKKFAEDNFDEFVEDWRMIEEPKDRAEVYIKMCRYVVPTLQSVSFEDETAKKITIEEKMREMAQQAEK